MSSQPQCPPGTTPSYAAGTTPACVQIVTVTPYVPPTVVQVACDAPYTASAVGGCEQRCPNGTTVSYPATCPQPRVVTAPASAPASAPAVAPSQPSLLAANVYCTPPLSASGGISCPFVIQVVAGNDIPRISGRESRPPVSMDLSLSGATLTVTLTNNTVDALDLSHTHIVRTAPRITPVNPRASSGNVTVQGNTVTQDGFSLPSAGTNTLTIDLQTDAGQALPSNAVDAIRADDLNGVDAQTGNLLAQLSGKGVVVTYRAGFNLIGGPTGTQIHLPPDTLYALQSGDRNYRTITTPDALTGGLKGGAGYLDQVSDDRIEVLRATDPQTVTVSLPAGQWVMIGNPGTSAATVSGADQVLTYDPANGYQPTTTLQPGQGAWAVSLDGGLATIVNVP